MAVQKSKKSRSKRGMRRSQEFLETRQLSVDSYTGEQHVRHCVTDQGYYRGKSVLKGNVSKANEDKN